MTGLAKALSTLVIIVAEFGDCSRQCGQGLTLYLSSSFCRQVASW